MDVYVYTFNTILMLNVLSRHFLKNKTTTKCQPTRTVQRTECQRYKARIWATCSLFHLRWEKPAAPTHLRYNGKCGHLLARNRPLLVMTTTDLVMIVLVDFTTFQHTKGHIPPKPRLLCWQNCWNGIKPNTNKNTGLEIISTFISYMASIPLWRENDRHRSWLWKRCRAFSSWTRNYNHNISTSIT